jgi:prepilin-type N-terminal cleavage/methylation domain-containing protein
MRTAFTLVELMVVLAVIVILLALLSPALDRAVYQAELSICGSQLRGIAVGANAYAVGNRRSYPYRAQVNGNGAHLNRLALGNNAALDDRPRLRPYMPLTKIMQDPLNGKFDIDTLYPNAEVYGSYNLWFWVRFQSRNSRGMYKVGDRWTWTNNDSGQPIEYRFNYLASDRDRFLNVEWVANPHPDSSGTTSLVEWKEPSSPADSAPPNERIYAQAEWNTVGRNRTDRGLIDMNFASDDTSVIRYNAVAHDEWRKVERTTRVPSLTNDSLYRDTTAAPGYFDQVPRP